MPQLIAPTPELESAWRAAHAEWGPGLHEDGFGLRPDDDVDTPAGFSAWLRRLAGDGTCTYRWIVEDGTVLGGIALRHGDAAAIRRAGHIGYGIRPSARRQGFALWALRAMLAEARRGGLPQVVLICREDNPGSVRTIERAGGVLDGGTLAADDGGRSDTLLHDAGNAPARDGSRTPGCGGDTTAIHEGGTAPIPAGGPGLRRYLISTAQHTP